MKRAELEVGKAYWYATSTRWEDHLSEGSKAVVVDAGCWSQPRSGGWGRTEPEPRKIDKGSGVLVEVTRRGWSTGEETIERRVVNLTALRGPYEETQKSVQEAEEKRREAKLAEDKRLNDNKEKTEIAIKLAKDNGAKSAHASSYGNTEICISAADLTLLIEKSLAR